MKIKKAKEFIKTNKRPKSHYISNKSTFNNFGIKPPNKLSEDNSIKKLKLRNIFNKKKSIAIINFHNRNNKNNSKDINNNFKRESPIKGNKIPLSLSRL